MSNVIDLVARRKISALSKHVKELDEISKILKTSINSLTKYDKYSTIKHRVGDLVELYRDIKQAKESKSEILQRLKNE